MKTTITTFGKAAVLGSLLLVSAGAFANSSLAEQLQTESRTWVNNDITRANMLAKTNSHKAYVTAISQLQHGYTGQHTRDLERAAYHLAAANIHREKRNAVLEHEELKKLSRYDNILSGDAMAIVDQRLAEAALNKQLIIASK